MICQACCSNGYCRIAQDRQESLCIYPCSSQAGKINHTVILVIDYLLIFWECSYHRCIHGVQAIDRPLFKDFWERFRECLTLLRDKHQRTVYRSTTIPHWPMPSHFKQCAMHTHILASSSTAGICTCMLQRPLDMLDLMDHQSCRLGEHAHM